MADMPKGPAQFMDSEGDVEWLKETHLKGREYPPFASFTLYGTEDAPERVHLYRSPDPLNTDDFTVVEFGEDVDAKAARIEQFRKECCANACSQCNRLYNRIVLGIESDEFLR